MHQQLALIRRSTKTAFLLVGCLLLAIQPTLASADFFNDNNILFYDPNSAVATCSVGGAGVGIGAGATVPKDFNLGTNPAQRQVNLIKAFMADYGLTAAQAAGPVGNFMLESGGKNLPPDFNEGDHEGAPPKYSGGYGWAQWTNGRQPAFINYSIEHGYMASKTVHATDAANYAYLKSELATGYKNTIPELKKQTTPEEAAVSFEATYESASAKVLDTRKANAREALTAYNGGATSAPGTGGTASASCPSSGAAAGGAAIVGSYAFPLSGTKRVVKNPGIFKNGTTSLSGHPYNAYDILADPGSTIVAFLSGTVTHIGEDKCPGQLISVYNKESDLTISYLHMSFSDHVKKGDVLTVGQKVGVVGAAANGCGTPHLHIDAAKGAVRPGCKRESCPAANAAKFVIIGPQLYTTFQALPD